MDMKHKHDSEVNLIYTIIHFWSLSRTDWAKYAKNRSQLCTLL